MNLSILLKVILITRTNLHLIWFLIFLIAGLFIVYSIYRDNTNGLRYAIAGQILSLAVDRLLIIVIRWLIFAELATDLVQVIIWSIGFLPQLSFVYFTYLTIKKLLADDNSRPPDSTTPQYRSTEQAS